MKSRIATIMFTDIYGFTQLSEFKGRRRLVEIVGGLHTLIESVIREFDGKVIKSIGDSLMVIFDSPTAAVLCAVEVQKQNRKRNQTLPELERIEIRIGLNTGEITEIDDDVYGEAVNVASRVEGECEPGGVYFTEATHLATNRERINAVLVGVRALKGLTYKVKLYKVPVEEMEGAILGKRSLSFFGLLGRDAANQPLVMLPAPTSKRIISGIIDFWLSVVMVIVFPLMLNIRPIYSWLTEAIRIESEDLAPGEKYPCNITTAVPEFFEYAFNEYLGTGLEYGDSLSETPRAGRASCNRYLKLGSNQHIATTFTGTNNTYDIIYAYTYQLDHLKNFLDGGIGIGSHRLPLIDYYRGGFAGREVLAKGLALKNGDPIVIDTGDNGTGYVLIDFLEFIPTGAKSNRPKGITPNWRYWEFYSWIYYDDMNFHFFAIRFPASFFLLILFSYLIFGRTPGNIIQGVYLVGQNGSLHFGHYLLRTITLCLLPLWGVFYIREDRLLTDVVSGSKVVVRRIKRE